MFDKSKEKEFQNLKIFFSILLPDVEHDVVVVKLEIVAFEPNNRWRFILNNIDNIKINKHTYTHIHYRESGRWILTSISWIRRKKNRNRKFEFFDLLFIMFFFLSLWYIMYTQNKNNKQK